MFGKMQRLSAAYQEYLLMKHGLVCRPLMNINKKT